MSKVRYLVVRAGLHGPLFYWQPSSKLRAQGWRSTRLAAATLAEACVLAELRNEELDRIQAENAAATVSRRDSLGIKQLAPIPAMKRPAERPVQRLSRRTLRNAASRSHSPDAEMFIYIMGTSDGLQKIGVSIRPEERRVALCHQSGQNLRLWFTAGGAHLDAEAAEKLAHMRLEKARRVGEWFAVTPANAIDAVLNAIRDTKHKNASRTLGVDLQDYVKLT